MSSQDLKQWRNKFNTNSQDSRQHSCSRHMLWIWLGRHLPSIAGTSSASSQSCCCCCTSDFIIIFMMNPSPNADLKSDVSSKWSSNLTKKIINCQMSIKVVIGMIFFLHKPSLAVNIDRMHSRKTA